MEVKEIEGKKYIEFQEHKNQRKKFVVSVLFLILLAIAIMAMIVTTFILIQNKDLISKDPLRYGMDVHGFVSCQCLDGDGMPWYSEGPGFANRKFTNEIPKINEVMENRTG